jgi:hypothetical protein
LAVSINQAQAKAGTDFLDDFGEGKDMFRECANTMERLAGVLAKTAQDNLNKSDRNATGRLSESIKVKTPQINGSKVQIDIEALFYYQFVDKGVKGTRGGNGEYSFKNENVGTKFKDEIRKWVIREGIKARSIKNEKLSAKTSRVISKREKKRKSITQTSDSVAYAIARSIKRKGLKKTNFMTKAINEVKKLAREELAKGLKVDILASLPKKLN